MPAPSEKYDVVVRDLYPAIDPVQFKDINTGKVVFITGGGTGVGLATAKAYIKTGAKVFITGRRTEVLKSAKQELQELGGDADFAYVDVTNEESVKSAVAAAVHSFGRIDIVVANAGSSAASGVTIEDANATEWWGSMEANLKGSFLTAQATLPELKKSGNGYIVFVSSSLGQTRYQGTSAYNIAKHATNRLAEWIDIENRSAGVKSIAFHPGSVSTDLSVNWATSVGLDPKHFSMSPELPAWTTIRLTSGLEDWLSGRFFDSSWGFDVVHNLKEKIIEQDALKNRLALPQ